MLNIDTGIIRERHPNGTVLCAFVKKLSEDEAKFAAERNIKEIVIDYGESYYRVHRNKKNEVTKIVKYIKKINYEVRTIGMSDKGYLTMLAHNKASTNLNFGGDGVYTAKIYKGKDSEVPAHYKKVYTCTKWLSFYDDLMYEEPFAADHIEIYRAGEFGCAIKLWNNWNCRTVK